MPVLQCFLYTAFDLWCSCRYTGQDLTNHDQKVYGNCLYGIAQQPSAPPRKLFLGEIQFEVKWAEATCPAHEFPWAKQVLTQECGDTVLVDFPFLLQPSMKHFPLVLSPPPPTLWSSSWKGETAGERVPTLTKIKENVKEFEVNFKIVLENSTYNA